MTEEKTRRYAISTPEMEELGARCQRFEDLLKKTVMDFVQNDGPLPLSLLQTGWQEAIGHLLVTGFEEVLPKFVERPRRVSSGVHNPEEAFKLTTHHQERLYDRD